MAPLSGDDPRHLGGFRVLTLLAVGGMGRVYLALGPDRRAVALKVARPEFAADARFRARFRREVATASQVGVGGGALIAPVVAADPEAELPWLASEYVPGPSLTDAAMRFGPLGEAGLRTLTHRLALALTEVHAMGVVHRDVKPSNVLLARDGPRLIDFGVARALDDVGLTRVGALIGSPGFLSPEQAVGEPATYGSDVFALASVVAYAARGQSPFGAGDGAALLYRVVHEPPKLEGLPPDLTEVLAACLSKDPGERPSAPELAALIAPEEPWLPDAMVEDIARREAELAAWLEVTAANPVRVRAVSAAFDKAADSALDIANTAAVTEAPRTGTRRRELDAPTDGIRQPGLPRTSAAQPAAAETASQPEPESPGYLPRPAATPPGAAYTAFLLDPTAAPDPTTAPDPPIAPDPRIAPSLPAATHHRAPRRRRFPVYAALGAFLGAAAATGILLLPHGGHGTPSPSQGPASTSGTHGAASPSIGRSGSVKSPETTSASGSRP